MEGRRERERVRKSRSPGNDTDVKIASKAVAIKSNTRVRLKKLVGERDLLKRWETNKKKKRCPFSRKACSPGINHR